MDTKAKNDSQKPTEKSIINKIRNKAKNDEKIDFCKKKYCN